MRHFPSIAGAAIAATMVIAGCSQGPDGSDLFGDGARPGALAGSDAGGAPSAGGALAAGGATAGRAGAMATGGAPQEPPLGGQGGDSGDGGENGGFGGDAKGGASSSGTAGTGAGAASGASSGGAGGSDGGGSGASPSGAGGMIAGGNGGTAGNVASAGTGGKLEPRQCNELREKADTYLAEAQACKPSNDAACRGTVKDECGCQVVVNDSNSAATDRYLEIIEQLRTRCTVACLTITCRAVSNPMCSSTGPGDPRCTSRAFTQGNY